MELLLDGRQVAQVDLRTESPLPSAPLFEAAGLVDDFHALVVRGTTGPVVLDSLEIHCRRRSHRDA